MQRESKGTKLLFRFITVASHIPCRTNMTAKGRNKDTMVFLDFLACSVYHVCLLSLDVSSRNRVHVEINIYTNEKSNKFKQINCTTHAPMNIPTTQTNQNTFRDRYYATVSAPELLRNCDIDEHLLSFQHISPTHNPPPLYYIYVWLINKYVFLYIKCVYTIHNTCMTIQISSACESVCIHTHYIII